MLGPVDDKFVIDDDMESDTGTESNLSPRSRSFLNRVTDRLRKVLDNSSEDAMQTIDKLSMIWRMLMTSTLEASISWERITQTLCTPSKRWKSHFKAEVRHVWKVDSVTIRWDFRSVSNQLGKFSMETIFPGEWWRSHQSLACKGFLYSEILCNVLERWIGTQHQILFVKNIWVGSKIHFNRELWTQLTENRWNSSGIFSRIHFIAARRRSPTVHEQKERPSAIPRTDYLHDDGARWHHMGN